MNLLFSRLLRDFIDRKHRFVAGSQVNDRAQRSEPRPTVDFVPVVASKRDRSNDLFQFPAVITEILRQIFLPFSLFLSSFFSISHVLSRSLTFLVRNRSTRAPLVSPIDASRPTNV